MGDFWRRKEESEKKTRKAPQVKSVQGQFHISYRRHFLTDIWAGVGKRQKNLSFPSDSLFICACVFSMHFLCMYKISAGSDFWNMLESFGRTSSKTFAWIQTSEEELPSQGHRWRKKLSPRWLDLEKYGDEQNYRYTLKIEIEQEYSSNLIFCFVELLT